MSKAWQQGWPLDELLKPWGVNAGHGITALGLSMDSRLVDPGDVYLALSGSTYHGLQFAKQALENGAVAVLCDKDISKANFQYIEHLNASGSFVFFVEKLESRVIELADAFYGHPGNHLTIIGVTGTDGKTSVCHFVAQALQTLGRPCGYIGTLGWGFPGLNISRLAEFQKTALTTPDKISIRRILAELYSQGAQFVAIEASSHGIAEGRLAGLAIDIAVLTNLGRDHLDYHGTEQAYRAAKEQLFHWPNLAWAVLNADDTMGSELLLTLTSLRRVACSSGSVLPGESLSSPEIPAVVASRIETTDAGLRFDLSVNQTTSSIRTDLLGRFNVDNLLACYAVLMACGIAANDARHAVERLKPVSGRMDKLTAEQKPTVVIDYSHTPQALEAAIAAVQLHCQGQVWVVFGCGGDRDVGKRKLMARVAQKASFVVVTDDNPRTEPSIDILADILEGFDRLDCVTVIADRVSAIDHAVTRAQPGDWILVAGKGHEDYQIFGSTHYPLSDRDTALASLAGAS